MSENSCFNFFFNYQNTNVSKSREVMKSLVSRSKLESLVEIFLAEIMGTALLMFFGCMGLFANPKEVVALPPMQGGIVFGFIVSSLIVAIGHISKAHLNPAVTLCSYLLGMITPITAIVYFIAECLGCLLGIWLLTVTTPYSYSQYSTDKPCGFCTTVLHENVDLSQGFLIEYLATSFLIYVVCSVWDPRNAQNTDSTAIKFGLLIAALSIAAGPFTGASMNPARTLGPAIINNVWRHHWVYWLAPLSGSAVTTMFYKYCFLKSAPSTDNSESSVVKSPSHDNTKAINEKNANAV